MTSDGLPARLESPSPISDTGFSSPPAVQDEIHHFPHGHGPAHEQPFISKNIPHTTTRDSAAYDHEEEIQHQSQGRRPSSGATLPAISAAAAPHSHRQRRWILLHRLWLWELGASVLSLVCIASIAAVASSQQGKPLEEWRRGLGRNISPTAVVSFLGTIGKSACLVALASIVSQLKWMHFSGAARKLSDLQLFDDASRGPMGALLLVMLRNKTTLLASCASVVTLASLLLDPFVQLIFDFPSELRPAVEGAAPGILSSQTYDPFALPRELTLCYSPTRVDSAMQAAMLAPVWDAAPAPSLPCGFERCEWPTITTLGVCSSCVDLTDEVNAECRLPSMKRESIACEYTIESVDATFQAEFAITGSASTMTPYHTLWNSTATEAPRYLDDSGPPRLGEFTFIRFAEDLSWRELISVEGDRPRLTGDPPVEQAMQCTLSLCMRTFETPYYANFSAGPLTGREIPLKFASVPNVTEYVAQYITLSPDEDTGEPDIKDETFTINYCDYINIADYISSLFTLEWLTTGVVPLSRTDQSSTPRQKVTPNIGLILSRTSNMTALMQSVADSMTEAFRTSANSTSTRGAGLNTVTYISIDWAWLSLPVAVVTLAFVMLVVVIARNQVRGIPAWKSSSLALLFHELDGWDNSRRVGLDGPAEVDMQASEMTARVMKNEKGVLTFSRA